MVSKDIDELIELMRKENQCFICEKEDIKKLSQTRHCEIGLVCEEEMKNNVSLNV